MVVGNVWEAMAGSPWRFLTSSWPWRSLAYLVGGVVTGAAVGLVALALFFTGLVLLIAVAGLLAFLALALLGIPVARLERLRLRLVDVDPVPDPHAPAPGGGLLAWLRLRLREQATWREFGFTALSLLALYWVDAGMLVAAFGVTGGLIATPAYTASGNLGAWVLAATGVGLLPGAIYLLSAWAAARATMARTMLGPRDAELSARLTEVSRSRARLVHAFEQERRRIERDLHDGAQRHLVAVSVSLGMARLDLPDGVPATDLVEKAQIHAERALVELRGLIRGVHPQVLTDRGLPAAVADLASDLPMPVDVRVDLPERPPEPVETTVYFCISEALTNVARHSAASQVRVCVSRFDGVLVAEVEDDGRGGADPAAGRGLAGLADRLAVLDGRLRVVSPLGGPTTVRFEVPVR
jgi:signal transduction histidine kinase